MPNIDLVECEICREAVDARYATERSAGIPGWVEYVCDECGPEETNSDGVIGERRAA